MTRIFLFASAVIIVLIQSCASDSRLKLSGQQLTVYYFQENEAETAEKVAFFWKEAGLLTGEKQDLQLRRIHTEYTLSIIAREDDAVDKMTFDDIQLLAQLKRRLYDRVFNKQSFNLVICNKKFEPIYTVE